MDANMSLLCHLFPDAVFGLCRFCSSPVRVSRYVNMFKEITAIAPAL